MSEIEDSESLGTTGLTTVFYFGDSGIIISKIHISASWNARMRRCNIASTEAKWMNMC
jgi:hypothetical protein